MSTPGKVDQTSTQKSTKTQPQSQQKPGCFSRFTTWTKKTWKDKIQVRIDRDVRALEKRSEVI